MAWMRQALLQQRQILSVIVNGVQLIPQNQTGVVGNKDAKNGPLPQSCQIINLNDTLFLVNYHIIAHYWENSGPIPTVPVTNTNIPSNSVLYNRWTESIVIDDRNITHRTRRGRFAIRSDNLGGFIPDQLRTQMAIVGIPANFLRTRNEYTVTEDGLNMSYSQEDQEVARLPPVPAFKAEGSMTVTTSKDSTALVTARVHLWGDCTQPINDNQTTLAFRAISIVNSKLLEFKQWTMVQNATLNLNFFDNEVEYSQTVRVAKSNFRLNTLPGLGVTTPIANIIGGLDFFYDVDASVPFVSSGPTAGQRPNYLIRGTAGLLLEAASYYDPNITTAIVTPQVGGTLSNIDVGTTVPTQTGKVPSQLSNAGAVLRMPGQ